MKILILMLAFISISAIAADASEKAQVKQGVFYPADLNKLFTGSSPYYDYSKPGGFTYGSGARYNYGAGSQNLYDAGSSAQYGLASSNGPDGPITELYKHNFEARLRDIECNWVQDEYLGFKKVENVSSYTVRACAGQPVRMCTGDVSCKFTMFSQSGILKVQRIIKDKGQISDAELRNIEKSHKIEFTAGMPNILCQASKPGECPTANECLIRGGFLENYPVEKEVDRSFYKPNTLKPNQVKVKANN